MAQPDEALGIAVNFDNDGFRNAIRFAEQMGRNPDPDKAIKFMSKSSTAHTYWKDDVELSETPPLDRDGYPFDTDIEVRVPDAEEILDYSVDPDGRPVDCAIEVVRADQEEQSVGTFQPTKVVVTLLDHQYELVKDCREIVYNGDVYMYGYEPESTGLFSVGVYTIVYYARDES